MNTLHLHKVFLPWVAAGTASTINSLDMVNVVCGTENICKALHLFLPLHSVGDFPPPPI